MAQLQVVKAVLFIPGGETCSSEPRGNFLRRLESALCMASRGDLFCVAGGLSHPSSEATESEVGAGWLERRGISSGRILLEKSSVDSVSNVVRAWGMYHNLLADPLTKIIIVSQWPHANRIARTFRALGKVWVEVIPCPYGSWLSACAAVPYEAVAWAVYHNDPLGSGWLAQRFARYRSTMTPAQVNEYIGR